MILPPPRHNRVKYFYEVAFIYRTKSQHLKTDAFIAGKKNPATQIFFIRFSIETLIANISFYALSWPKLNFGCYLTFEIIFKASFQWKNE